MILDKASSGYLCHCPEPYYNEDTGPFEKEVDKQVMVVHGQNSSTQEVEEGGLQV